MRALAHFRWSCAIGLGAFALAWLMCMMSLESTLAAPPKAARQTAKPDQSDTDDSAASDDEGADKHIVRLNYVEASWSKVLKDFAEATQTELVADTVPPQKYSRWDLKRHSRADALKILNQALEPENYRLQFKGHYLLLNHLKDFRHEYPAAVLRGDSHEGAREEAKPDSGVQNAAAEKVSRLQPTPRGRSIRQTSGEVDGPSATTRQKAEVVPSEPIETTVRLKSRNALAITKIMYKAFKPQAEEIDDGDGPQGLGGFLVRRQARQGAAAGSDELPGSHELPVQFSIGMDRNKNQLVVQASPHETKSLVRFIKTLDTAPKNPQAAVRAVKTTKDAGKLAAALQPELDRLSGATRKITRQKTQTEGETADEQDADLNSEEDEPPVEKTPPRSSTRRGAARGQTDDAAKPTTPQGLLGSLKGEVRVESVPELGILVVTGNQNDVEAVMEVIQEIERLSKGTAPEVRVALLRHVSSEALAALLTTVYERLGNVRNSAVQQSQSISVFPVSRPNAVLIVASKADMDNVSNLIEELDQPSDPATEFMVYRLKYAVPSQIVDKVEAMYPPQQQAAGANQQPGAMGLIPRVRIIDDLRTNSVIVQARPRDLREVVLLIEKLDAKDSDSHQQIKIFPLNYAVADEVAFTLSSSIQNVLGPARATAAPTIGQPGGGAPFGGNQPAAGAQGQGAAELRAVKSTILQFLDEDGKQGRDVRSGILSDIRMTGDLRTNSIVVTAPEDSMEFVAMLIKRLDKPSAAVAEIKVFQLKNADATSVQTLLERLFGIQRTGQQGGQGGQAGGAQGIPGLLMADSEDSSSMLIPLRFSVDARTNSVIAIGGGGALTVVEAVVLKLDATNIPQRKNEVYRLKMNTALAVATAIGQFLQTQQTALTAVQPEILSPFEQIEREVIVVPEAVSNSVLISATPRYFEEIHKLIVQLDRTPQQVLIQGLIVEVQLTNTDEFGMELGLQDSVLFRRSSIPAPTLVGTTVTAPNGNTTTNNSIISETANPGYLFNGAATQLGNNTFPGASNPANIAGQALTGFNTALSSSSLGYGGLVLQAGSQNINFLLRALAARVRVDVLSRPQIRALDNQVARIMVGQEIPRINGFLPQGTAGVIAPLIEQRQIGIILDVTPRISPDGLVIMSVMARKDSLDQKTISLGASVGGTSITSPIVNTTNAQSTVAVISGQTVIVGGMITKQDNVEERKVPILGDIPILGRAFRYDFKQMARTELLIFLTPRIIKSDEEAEMFKQIEIERMNFIESEAERMHGPLFGMGEYCPPPTGPGSAVSPPEPVAADDPVMRPSPRKSQPVPPPPDANIPGSASTRKNREPHPMPAVEDDEDLDAGFIQTGYRVPQDAGPATGKTPPAKTGSKSPLAPGKKGKTAVKSPAKQNVKRTAEQKPAQQSVPEDS